MDKIEIDYINTTLEWRAALIDIYSRALEGVHDCYSLREDMIDEKNSIPSIFKAIQSLIDKIDFDTYTFRSYIRQKDIPTNG